MFKHKRTVSKRKRTVRIAVGVTGAAVAAIAAAASAQAIVGGTPTTIDKNSFLVALQFRGNPNWCTGTLISPTKVVTTISCLVSSHDNGPPNTTVIAGRTNVFDKDGNKNKVKNVWFNPSYKDGDGRRGSMATPGDVQVPNNDIAVIELKHPMPSKYKPIKWVSSGFNYEPGTQARIVGWGTTDPAKVVTNGELREATLPIVSDADCTSSYKGVYNSENMVCAGRKAGGVDACYRDLAVPLLVSDGKEELLAGLLSWGGKCATAGNPGVYTRVSTFADWLTQVQSQ